MATYPVATFGQATDGNIAGAVLDASSAVIPGASVQLENIATGVKRSAETDMTGLYRFNNVLVGKYRITVRAQSFAAATLENVEVALNRTTTANLTLEPAAVATEVEVTEAAALIDTTTATIGSSFKSREAIYTPASSLAYGVYNLALMSAGVAGSGGVGLGEGPAVGGQRPRQNNFMVEGVDNNRKEVTGGNIRVPSEAVREFSSLQNQVTAEFGHSTGGQFNIALNSGTNQIHGSLYEYFANRNLNAVDEADARQGIRELPRYDSNTFGGSLGGPIVKNKLFYYGLFQYNPLGQASSPASPTLAPTAEGYRMLESILGLSQSNLNILKQYADPAPSASATTTVQGQEIPIGILPISFPNYWNTSHWVGNADWNISDGDQLRFRYVESKQSGVDITTSPNLPAFANNRTIGSRLLTLSQFHTFSPTFFNELRLSYGRYSDDIPAGDFQFPGLDLFPNIEIEEDLNLQIGPLPEAPQSSVENHYQLVNNTTVVKGDHGIKFGVDVRRYINPGIFVQRSRGDYVYSTLERYLLDIQPDLLAQRSVGSTTHWANQWNFYWFVQDEWKLRHNVTLSLGLRHEYRGVPAGDKLQTLNSVSSVPGVLEFREPKAQKKNFAPRVGLTWSPGTSGNTVLRAGFGMAYDNYFDNLGTITKPPQLQTSISLPNADASNFLAAGGIPPDTPGEDKTPEEWRALTGTYTFDQHLPYSIQWNFGVERVIAKDYTVNVRYLGTRGVRLFTQSRINNGSVVGPDRHLPTLLSRPTQAELDALSLTLDELQADFVAGIYAFYGFPTDPPKVRDFYVPAFRDAGLTNLIYAFPNRGNSIYHGLATEFTRRFSQGLLFKTAYTWSKNIDDSTADLFSTVLSPRRPQDFGDMRSERSRSFLDRTHRFTLNWVYGAQWLNNHTNWSMRNLLGNWIFGGTCTVESPQYATVQSVRDATLNADGWTDRAIVNPAGRRGVGTDVVELTNSSGQVVAYLAENPNARYIRAGVGAWPNAGRQSLPQGHIKNFDLAVTKRFDISESKALEFRALFYNAFNHPQYTPGSINTVGYTNTNNITRNHLLPGHELFGDITRVYSSNPRSVVLAGRFTF